MERVLEPELMDDEQQAEAYAGADFSVTHELFVTRFGLTFPEFESGLVADLCCGNADPTIRFAKRFPSTKIVGFDGAEAMLAQGRKAIERAGLNSRVTLKRAMLPLPTGTHPKFDVVLCNGSMHHLPDSSILWESVKNLGRPGTLVFVVDLMRPATQEKAQQIVEQHSNENDPSLMKRDFYNSLLASFRPEEVREQIFTSGLGYLRLEVVSNRHMMIYGRLR